MSEGSTAQSSGGLREPEYRQLTGGLLKPEYRRRTAGLLLVMSFVAFEQISVATILPAVLASLHDVALYGWAFSAFMLAQVAGIVWLARRWTGSGSSGR